MSEHINIIFLGTNNISTIVLSKKIKEIINKLLGDFIILPFTPPNNVSTNLTKLLHEALHQAKNEKAYLVIEQLTSFKEVKYLKAIAQSEVNFVFLDFPTLNQQNIFLLITFLNYKKSHAGTGIKKGLQKSKADGNAIGNPNIASESVKRNASTERQLLALYNESNRAATELIIKLKNKGLNFNKIAAELNKRGIKTRRGKSYYAKSVTRLYNTHVDLQNSFKTNNRQEQERNASRTNMLEEIVTTPVDKADCSYQLRFTFKLPLLFSLKLYIEDNQGNPMTVKRVNITKGVTFFEYPIDKNTFKPGCYYWQLKKREPGGSSLTRSFFVRKELMPPVEHN